MLTRRLPFSMLAVAVLALLLSPAGAAAGEGSLVLKAAQVRGGGGEGFVVLGWLEAGESVEVLLVHGEWAIVALPEGWVPAQAWMERGLLSSSAGAGECVTGPPAIAADAARLRGEFPRKGILWRQFPPDSYDLKLVESGATILHRDRSEWARDVYQVQRLERKAKHPAGGLTVCEPVPAGAPFYVSLESGVEEGLLPQPQWRASAVYAEVEKTDSPADGKGVWRYKSR